ncbi:alpha/beta hydrolase domain-containing protein [Pseudoroseicyclus sp. CXY001]|uniref:alpha/beta hydrolase domain-containing protein n=1 Tax=Pseudoroseicyclus sp. CXY001 TaxID=3242492 RepID=UPI003570CB1F
MNYRTSLLAGTTAMALGLAATAARAETPALPQVEGPVAEQAGNLMHPAIFETSIRPYLGEFPDFFDMDYYGYVADEFFLTGTAGGEDYTTRLVIRHPADIEDWSGFTVFETQHTSGAAQAWTYSRIGSMKNGHVFVELDDHPGAIANIQGFNAARYADMHIASEDPAMQNEMAAQAMLLVRTANPLGEEWNAGTLAMAGLSQTANNISDYFHLGGQASYTLEDGSPLVDGAILGVRTGPTTEELAEFWDVPLIVTMSQTEFQDFTAADEASWPADGENFRRYQVPGAPHLESRYFFATDPATCGLPGDGFMAMAYFYMAVEDMYEWLMEDTPAPMPPHVEFDESGPVRDEFGNVRGGIRSPQLEVPTHVYLTPNEGESFLCSLAGASQPLTDAQLQEMYASPGDFQHQLESATLRLVEEGWFPDEYLFEIDEEVARFGDSVGFGYTGDDAEAAE